MASACFLLCDVSRTGDVTLPFRRGVGVSGRTATCPVNGSQEPTQGRESYALCTKVCPAAVLIVSRNLAAAGPAGELGSLFLLSSLAMESGV